MRISVRPFLTLAIISYPLAASAQELDCSDPGNLPQQGMNQCAYLEWQEADARLNAFWPEARRRAKEIDSYQSDELKGADEALLRSQRAWIEYRDGTCEVAGFYARGGSLEPLLRSTCLTQLTENRISELEQILAGE